MVCDNQAHLEHKFLVFLEFTHIFEAFLIASAKAQGMLTKFYDHPLHFMFIVCHINGSFVREGTINVVLGGHISLLGVCSCPNTRLIIGRCLELGFPKCFCRILILWVISRYYIGHRGFYSQLSLGNTELNNVH